MNVRHAVIATEQIDDVILVAEVSAGGVDAICGVYFPGHWTNPDWASFGPMVDSGSDVVLAAAEVQMREYLAGERTEFTFAVAAPGSAFQESVWEVLRSIPFGETMTYGQIAQQLGTPGLARMVGQAVGHNPLSIVVPCHRVVGSSGKLTGYAGGLERKEFLLSLEGQRPVAARLF